MTNTNVIGIDLAKNIIQICTINKHGEILSNKAITPIKLKELLAKLKPAIVAMEGCGSCHYWARFAQKQGHEIRIISPKKVKAYLQGQKTDANDALAIAVASMQVGMVFSQLKTEEQQMLQTLESSRKFLDKEATALSNHIRAYLYEYDITTPRGNKGLKVTISGVLDEQDNQLPKGLEITLRILWARYLQTRIELKESQQNIAAIVKQNEPCKRLMSLEGVGPVCASMLYASLGNGKGFKNGRQASVYIGLTPKQHSSGGKVFMRGIDKHGGNVPMRSALYQGALAVITRLPAEPRTEKESWLISLVARAGVKRACIALANKTVRTAWALLSTGQKYQPVLLAA
jgi:transposase